MPEEYSPADGACEDEGADPARAPSSACTSCAAARDDKPHVVEVNSTQIGPVVFTTYMDTTTGETFRSVGLALPPALSTSTELCTALPNPGRTVADVINGPSLGVSVAGEGIGPTASYSANGSGVLGCVGAMAGLDGGVTTSGTYGWAATPPTR